MPRRSSNPTVNLYTKGTNEPIANFNQYILSWLSETNTHPITGHKKPAAFTTLRRAYDEALSKVMEGGVPIEKWKAHQILMSNLTDLILNTDTSTELKARLSSEEIHEGGIRSRLSQGIVKNAGENFANLIVYVLADILSFQDEILVDKGRPKLLTPFLTMQRTAPGREKPIDIIIECDFCVFSRSDPSNAIIASAKTNLKERFHIGTMWKLFFDMLADDEAKRKWGLSASDANRDMSYVFVTADLIRAKRKGTHGPDIRDDHVRNLIAADASFFDYVFVSKKNSQISEVLNYSQNREKLFHELGCLLDLIVQKFNLPLSG